MPRIEATSVFKMIMKEHYEGLARAAASDDQRVAWCTSMGQVEMFRAFGFSVHFPENHGALLGATRRCMDYIPVANAEGYSPEICSYMTSDIGAFIRGETPLKDYYGIEKVPRPDVLFYNTNQCRELVDWFQYFSRRFDAPCIGINTPRLVDEPGDPHIGSVEQQQRDLVPVLAGISGTEYDEDRLREAVRLSRDASVLWKRVLSSARNRPAPISFWDAVIHMGPIVVLRGLREAVDYYQVLSDEMEKRVSDGVQAVEGERLRIYWEGMPVWGRLRMLSGLFEKHGVAVVASTYCDTWALDRLDPDRPHRSMAEQYTDLFINKSEERKLVHLKRMAADYGIDGFVFHNARTCPANSNGNFGMPGRLEAATGLPTLTLDGDLCDLRCFSDDQARTAIEAFIEQLEGSFK